MASGVGQGAWDGGMILEVYTLAELSTDSVTLTLPCPGRGTPHCALGLGHCTLLPDKSPAKPTQHHHHHLPATVSPQDLLTPPVPIPSEPQHSLSSVALAGGGSCIFPQTPIPRAGGWVGVAWLWHCSCPMSPPCSPWLMLVCPQHGGLAAVLGLHRSAHRRAGAAAGAAADVRGGLARPQPVTAVSGRVWGGALSPAETPPHSASPQVQDNVRPLRTITRAPAGRSGAALSPSLASCGGGLSPSAFQPLTRPRKPMWAVRLHLTPFVCPR